MFGGVKKPKKITLNVRFILTLFTSLRFRPRFQVRIRKKMDVLITFRLPAEGYSVSDVRIIKFMCYIVI